MTTSKDAALLKDASSILIPSLKEFAKDKVVKMNEWELMDSWNEFCDRCDPESHSKRL